MADNLIPGVGSIGSMSLEPTKRVAPQSQTDPAQQYAQVAAQARAASGASEVAVVSKPDPSSKENETKSKSEAKPEKLPEKPPEKPKNIFADVSLHFKIDAHSHNITILVLDRNTRKVLRSIPPEEVSKMGPGDLLSLFT